MDGNEELRIWIEYSLYLKHLGLDDTYEIVFGTEEYNQRMLEKWINE